MPNGYQWDQTMHLADLGRSIHCCTQNKGALPEPPVELWHVNKNLAVTLHNKDHACTHVHAITWHECNKRKLNIKYYRKPIILVYIFLLDA